MQCLKSDVGLLRCLSVPPSNIASAYHSEVSAESFVIVNSSWTSLGNILVRVEEIVTREWDSDTQEMMLVGHETARHHRVAERRVCAGAVLQQCDVFWRQLNGKAAPELLAWIIVALASVVVFFRADKTHIYSVYFLFYLTIMRVLRRLRVGKSCSSGEWLLPLEGTAPGCCAGDAQRRQFGHRCCRSGEWERALKTHATISLFLLSGSLRISAIGLWLLSELVLFLSAPGARFVCRESAVFLCVHPCEIIGFGGRGILLLIGVHFPSPEVHFVCRCAVLRFFCVLLYNLAFFCRGERLFLSLRRRNHLVTDVDRRVSPCEPCGPMCFQEKLLFFMAF